MKITLELTPAEFRALLLPSPVDDKIREWNEAALRHVETVYPPGYDDSFPSLDPSAKPHAYEQAEMTACCKHCGGGKDHAVHELKAE